MWIVANTLGGVFAGLLWRQSLNLAGRRSNATAENCHDAFGLVNVTLGSRNALVVAIRTKERQLKSVTVQELLETCGLRVAQDSLAIFAKTKAIGLTDHDSMSQPSGPWIRITEPARH